ncbi:unnamed protein product [Fusarium venenatum]|uniref:Uncharacterized protein n=1 Tax=Fusarium venenatum TaxID=56646 RepID=A0A2L2TD24_9HYPO|nr:uncharacterized protein FVRRES_07926 [Fusarium venenatum]CEI67849.1 unnamed protein product [Fusarium venenatum]
MVMNNLKVSRFSPSISCRDEPTQKILLIGKALEICYTAEPVEPRRRLHKLIWLLHHIGILLDNQGAILEEVLNGNFLIRYFRRSSF